MLVASRRVSAVRWSRDRGSRAIVGGSPAAPQWCAGNTAATFGSCGRCAAWLGGSGRAAQRCAPCGERWRPRRRGTSSRSQRRTALRGSRSWGYFRHFRLWFRLDGRPGAPLGAVVGSQYLPIATDSPVQIRVPPPDSPVVVRVLVHRPGSAESYCSEQRGTGQSSRTRRRPSYFGEITCFERTYSRSTSILGRPVSVHSMPFRAQGAK
jgi:hypothetical protein